MVVCVADVEQPPFVACEHHAPWCLAYGLLRVYERKNKVKVSMHLFWVKLSQGHKRF